ncbi:unnamed protein product [Heligmosomoides polygyrus]|uniref:PHD domain-containing protein n=1 Tax=Heligmosomoides polygyrus TaxID=6339 RepID=A0A183FZP6_HELPZ|nr:unnamed protein product [Heligmosomoides polygyrus]
MLKIKEEVLSDDEIAGKAGQLKGTGKGAEQTPLHDDAASDNGTVHLDINLKLTFIRSRGERERTISAISTNASIRPWLIYGTVGMQRPLDTIVQLNGADSYCICSRISHELLVECRNEKCALVWFHLSCVGLKSVPEGKF